MSVDQPDTIDITSTDRLTGDVVLTISDHLDWSDSMAHQSLFQSKLNRYLAFVETGEILESYPDAKGKSIVFSAVFKFPPDASGRSFLIRVKAAVESAGSNGAIRCSPVPTITDVRTAAENSPRWRRRAVVKRLWLSTR